MQDDNKIVFTYEMTRELNTVHENIQYQKALQNVEKELSSLNLSRGGKNADGFVFECLHVAEKNKRNMQKGNGYVLDVIDNNGIADFRMVDRAGHVSYQQAKTGYHGPNKYKIAKESYNGQTLVVDKGNQELVEYAQSISLPVEESPVSKDMAHSLTEVMKQEGKIRQKIGLSNTGPITSNLYIAAEQLSYAHTAGLNAAKGSAAFAAGVSMGKNMYGLIEGDKDLREFFLETSAETATAVGGAYVMGATGYLASGVATNVAEVLITTGGGQTIVSLGSVFATMSVAAGPVFLFGMAVGTGYSVIKSVKERSNQYSRKMSQLNRIMGQALASMEAAYQSLDQTIRDTYAFWNRSFDEGFHLMENGVIENDFENFSMGLDIVTRIFDSHVLFENMDDFDDFFFDENAVLNL
ncbi:MAG: hypothetical protein HFG76_01310 [Hungatella sp.]|nr:hypothetical protein [Hungatella sp.]